LRRRNPHEIPESIAKPAARRREENAIRLLRFHFVDGKATRVERRPTFLELEEAVAEIEQEAGLVQAVLMRDGCFRRRIEFEEWAWSDELTKARFERAN